MPAMKSILLAAVIGAMSTVPAHAVLIAMLLPFQATSEMVVGIVSRCSTTTSYRLMIKNAINDAVLYRKDGRLAPGRGVALPWSFGESQRATMLRVSVIWPCPDLDALKPLVGVTVRDLATKVPQFLGGDELLD